jgi:mRNA-degrading endonuclease toxin of MazEF toxin-antitoxin module
MWQAALRGLRAVLRPTRTTRPVGAGGYAGDTTDVPELTYAPFDDDRPDPGEIVWAWVPFEEDHTQGKDRPVLVIGRRHGLLLALMLTSRDHDRDAADEARHGRSWVDLGTGAWDRRGRPSEVRVDRVLQLDPTAVRRQGAALDRERFDRVAAAVRTVHRAHRHR